MGALGVSLGCVLGASQKSNSGGCQKANLSFLRLGWPTALSGLSGEMLLGARGVPLVFLLGCPWVSPGCLLGASINLPGFFLSISRVGGGK